MSLSWNCLSLIQIVMGLGNNVLFEESFKSRIYLSPLYTRKNTLRENSLYISSKITTIGVYGKRISWEHSLAIGPFFLSSIHWWTILGRDRECTLHLDHMGSMACWPLTSCVALGKSAELVVPRYSIYWMETIIGVSSTVVLRIKWNNSWEAHRLGM